MKRNQASNRCRSGFTLIELSVVMVIIGLLTVALLKLYETYNKGAVITATSDNIKAANAALQKYQDDNGFYPCPADPLDPRGMATDCAAPVPPGSGIRVVTGTGGREVRIGAMPLLDRSGQTKLISGSQTLDGWKNRLTYAVTTNMAIDPTSFVPGQGAIIVKAEDGTNLTTNGNILVLSHGENGEGAFTSTGVQVGVCPAGTKDAENCNDDAIFLSAPRSYALGVNYNDDHMEFSTATAVETTKACPAGSTMRGIKSNGDLICTNDLSCPAGSAFTGLLADGVTPNCQAVNSTCAPTEALVSMSMGSAPVCMRNLPGDCPPGHIQNGTNNTPGPDFGKPVCLQILMQCPPNYVQVGVQAGNQPICVANFNSACPGGQIQIGNDSNGGPICKFIDLAACPAGQYLYGMNNGTPLCSGDRTVTDGTCPQGQSVTGIVNGTVQCAPINAGTKCYPEFPDVITCPITKAAPIGQAGIRRLHLWMVTGAHIIYHDGYAEAKGDGVIWFDRASRQPLAGLAWNVPGVCTSASLDDHIASGRAYWNAAITNGASCNRRI